MNQDSRILGTFSFMDFCALIHFPVYPIHQNFANPNPENCAHLPTTLREVVKTLVNVDFLVLTKYKCRLYKFHQMVKYRLGIF